MWQSVHLLIQGCSMGIAPGVVHGDTEKELVECNMRTSQQMNLTERMMGIHITHVVTTMMRTEMPMPIMLHHRIHTVRHMKMRTWMIRITRHRQHTHKAFIISWSEFWNPARKGQLQLFSIQSPISIWIHIAPGI